MDKKRKKFQEDGLMVYNIISNSNLTDEVIAEKLNVSTRLVYYYKTGERRISTLKLLKLLQITETNIQELEIPS
jgi:hypothetical protein